MKYKVINLDDYRFPVEVGEWATYAADENGNPVGEPLETGPVYDKPLPDKLK